MTGKLTWNQRQWSEGALVAPLPRLRRAYGNDVAGLAEMVRSLLLARREEPRMQDIKRTLEKIVKTPQKAKLDHLDSFIECELMREAYRLRRVWDLAELGREELSACANAVLLRVEGEDGPTRTDDLAIMLVCGLLELRPGLAPNDRNLLIESALRDCGFPGQGEKNIERLLMKAKKA